MVIGLIIGVVEVGRRRGKEGEVGRWGDENVKRWGWNILVGVVIEERGKEGRREEKEKKKKEREREGRVYASS